MMADEPQPHSPDAPPAEASVPVTPPAEVSAPPPEPPVTEVAPAPELDFGPPAAVSAAGVSPAEADRRAAAEPDTFAERPELFVAGAFAGAFLFAKLLKRLGGGD